MRFQVGADPLVVTVLQTLSNGWLEEFIAVLRGLVGDLFG